jgi:hypothetical protein
MALNCNRYDDYPIKKTIQYSFTLRNKTGRLLENTRLWAFAPVKKTPAQYCEKIEASHTFELEVDGFGNQVMCFSFDKLPPYATKIVSIKVALSMADVPNCFQEHADPYLIPETYVESDNPEILDLSAKMAVRKADITAERIFNWVAGNLQYTGYRSEERGALAALKSREGDCTEFMRLFVALCRAGNVPARSVGGYICRKKNNIVTPVDYHNWAGFYSGGTWHLADPQEKNFMEKYSDYIAMQILVEAPGSTMGEFRRYRFEGEGLEVKMNS